MRRLAAAVLAAWLAVVAAGVAGCASTGGGAPAGPFVRLPAPQLHRSVARAYVFLNQMMDKYTAGPTPRLVQSFAGGVLGARRFTASEIYDDAVLIDAYLSAHTPAALSRAEIIGNGLLYVQAHDPLKDGRIRSAYAPTPLRAPGDVMIFDLATPAGNMAWAGQALVQLYAASGRRAYLQGAEAIAIWIQVNCYDTRGAGGYTGGETASGQLIEWKSTEHNIDIYALFSMLASVTGNRIWSAGAAWAKRFIASMWDPAAARFDVGTLSDGVTTNDSETPEDINSWSYLALRDPVYAGSVDWDVRNLAVGAGGFGGVSNCRGDRTGVWFEGTAHLADALEVRGHPGDSELAEGYLSDIYHAQMRGPQHDRLGVIAASRNGLTDCSGNFYYTSLHTGTTAWYILAASTVDPFALISG